MALSCIIQIRLIQVGGNGLIVQNRSGSIASFSECFFFPVDTLQNGRYASTC